MTRSVRVHAFGDADVLRIEDVETGEAAVGEVRLRIHAMGLNRTEVILFEVVEAAPDEVDPGQVGVKISPMHEGGPFAAHDETLLSSRKPQGE